MSAPASPVMRGHLLPRWAKVDNFSSPWAARKVVMAAAAAVTMLVVVLSLSQTETSPSRLPPTSQHRLQDPIHDVFNATLGFQKILIINMPWRTDLRDSLTLAAAFTNLHVEYVDGVTMTHEDLSEQILPAEHPPIETFDKKNPGKMGNLGSWRAHMNAIQRIVEQNLTSALILEADVDWDLRIHQQMYDFARASRLLLQPIQGTTDQYLDPTFPYAASGQAYTDIDIDHSNVSAPTTSPYGDVHRWDMLWLGHCGASFPAGKDPNIHIPLGRAVLSNDPTVPEPRHLRHEYGSTDLKDHYPPHTRVVSRARTNVCSLAYAFTQQGARNALWELGLRRMNDAFDIMLRDVCDGTAGRPMTTCLTVQPQLFQHHVPVGTTFSDIHRHGGKENKWAYSHNIRLSTKSNLRRLVLHRGDYVDSWPDGREGLNKVD